MYFTYGMHWCANVVCGPDGEATAVLLRAGEVVEGLALARSRRPSARRDVELARGPARLATVLGIAKADDGADLCAPDGALRLFAAAPYDPELLRNRPTGRRRRRRRGRRHVPLAVLAGRRADGVGVPPGSIASPPGRRRLRRSERIAARAADRA